MAISTFDRVIEKGEKNFEKRKKQKKKNRPIKRTLSKKRRGMPTFDRVL